MTRNKKMRLFFLVCVLFTLAANFAHPVTPTIFSNLGLGNYMFGVALASMLIANFIFSPFWGKFNDFLSSRTTLLICSIGYAVGQLLFGLSRTEGHFIAARLFTGIFTGGAFVSILTYIVNTSKSDIERSENLAISATISSIGSAFGYFIGGFLGEVSTYLAVWVQVATLALSGILFFIFCEDDATVSIKDIDIKEVIKEANPLNAFFACRKFLTLSLAILFVICALQNLGSVAFDQTFNYYVKDQFNFSSGYNGVIKGLMGIITLVVNSTITLWIIKRTNLIKSNIYVFLVCSITMFFAIFISSKWPFVFINMLVFALCTISLPIVQSIVADASNENRESRNLIMGFYNAMKSLGGILAAMIAGFLYTKGPKLPFVFGLLATILAFVLALIYYKRHNRANALKPTEDNKDIETIENI